MKILTGAQIKQWDDYTIKNEPITSISLMERAAVKCVQWLEHHGFIERNFLIFCGKGNNGGDGLAIARILASMKKNVSVYIIETSQQSSADFQTNLERLKQVFLATQTILSKKDFPEVKQDDVIVDAIFGTGINRKPDGIAADTIEFINEMYAHFHCEVISIDMPSGLFADISSKENIVTWATHTLSFQCYKPAFLMAENATFTGKVHILDIGLHGDFLNSGSPGSTLELMDKQLIDSIYKPRDAFAHKGKFGHALLVAGSHGKIGAAVLAARACLRSGVGLLTCHLPGCGYDILQRSVPEAMVVSDKNESIISDAGDELSNYSSIGIGPGIGLAVETQQMLSGLFEHYPKPMVIDADALNIIGSEKKLLKRIPQGSVLTPHPKEFERLFGKTSDDFEKMAVATKKATEYKIVIVLKGHHSYIACPDGKGYFNATGNAGMATGGSGDVLTGIITGLLAQGYSSNDAARLGVYLHGLAGDLAALEFSQEAMVASDIIENLGEAYKSLDQTRQESELAKARE